jgi:hypothetical protein
MSPTGIRPGGTSGDKRRMTVEQPVAGRPARQTLKATDLAVADLDNDSLIVRLQMTVNHLSRWLTPITDPKLLMRSAKRGEKSVFELLQELRDTELVAFARMNAIANQINPDLDKLPDPRYLPEKEKPGYDRSPLSVMAQFRRLRQSTCALPARARLADSHHRRVPGGERHPYPASDRCSVAQHRGPAEHQFGIRRAPDGADEAVSRPAARPLIGWRA